MLYLFFKLLVHLILLLFYRSVLGSSVLDHLCYYGVNLKAETWNSCRIVAAPAPHLLKYTTTDNAGNIILSKDPTSAVHISEAATSNGVNVLWDFCLVRLNVVYFAPVSYVTRESEDGGWRSAYEPMCKFYA